MADLSGKAALVTGAGFGIGRGTAERLARDGADICVVDIDGEGAEHTASTVREFGREALVVKANVASPRQIQEAATQCAATLGRLDICVANAGIARGGSVLEMPLKDWQDQLDVNLTGVFLTVQAAAREMVRLGNGGRIVCISSLAAELTGAGTWAYSVTKVGVRMAVRGWAQELGQHGITVNAIGPGVIDTPIPPISPRRPAAPEPAPPQAIRPRPVHRRLAGSRRTHQGSNTRSASASAVCGRLGTPARSAATDEVSSATARSSCCRSR